MGTTYTILFKKKSYNKAIDLYMDMEAICKNSELYYKFHYKEQNETGIVKKIYVNISDKPFERGVSRQLAISIFDEPYEYREMYYEWYGEEVFFEAIDIDFVYENEDLFLDFLYEFMKVYKEAILWGENEWFYFYEDIVKIKQNKFDSNWCYKNPHS